MYDKSMNPVIKTETIVKGDISKIWDLWVTPSHIKEWMNTSDEWECTNATNDLEIDGKFVYTLAAKDKSKSFDFSGTYTGVEEGKYINYTIDDGRKVTIDFKEEIGCVHIIQKFEAENENPFDMQGTGWQHILDSFKKYAEKEDN